jgi:DNA-binding transcriptional LysR family regulator
MLLNPGVCVESHTHKLVSACGCISPQLITMRVASRRNSTVPLIADLNRFHSKHSCKRADRNHGKGKFVGYCLIDKASQYIIDFFAMIKSQITLKQLEALVAIVDLGSFRKAATVLATTQPNISNRISTLEDCLGVLLMHRDSGSVRLTDKGKVLVEAARKVLWNTEALLEAAARRDLIEDRMRLGVTELVACTWLHPFLRQFREVYPAVTVELEVGLSVEIDQKIAMGQIDLALQTGPFEYEASGTIPLGTHSYVWVAAPTIAHSLGVKTTLRQVLKSPVLIHARHTLAAKELSRLIEAQKLPSDQIVYSNSLASCVQMAIDGMGISLLPAALVRDHVSEGRLQKISVDWHPKPLEFYARFDRKRAPRFIEAAAELAAQTALLWQK